MTLVFPQFQSPDPYRLYDVIAGGIQQRRANEMADRQFSLQQANAARNADVQRVRLLDMQRKADIEAQDRQRAQLFREGVTSYLHAPPDQRQSRLLDMQGIDPLATTKFQSDLSQQRQAEVNLEKSEAESVEQQRKMTLGNLRRVENVFKVISKDPSQYPGLRQVLIDDDLMKPDDLPEVYDPNAIAGTQQQIAQMKLLVEDPEAADKLQGFAQQLAHEGIEPGTPNFQSRMNEFNRAVIEGKKRGGLQVNIGGNGEQTLPVAKEFSRKLQEDIHSGLNTLQTLRNLEETFRPEFATYAGKARKVGGDILAGLGFKNDQDFRQSQFAWRTEMEQFFNAYRKLITGSAAAVSELEALKDSILSSDTPPDLVQTAIGQLRSKVQREINTAQGILNRGIPINNEADFWSAFNSEMLKQQQSDRDQASASGINYDQPSYERGQPPASSRPSAAPPPAPTPADPRGNPIHQPELGSVTLPSRRDVAQGIAANQQAQGQDPAKTAQEIAQRTMDFRAWMSSNADLVRQLKEQGLSTPDMTIRLRQIYEDQKRGSP